MVQPILLNRTDTDDTDPPLLNYGELAVATGPTFTKMWLGDGGANRVLLSDDPADAPIFGGSGGGAFLPLTGGDLTGALTITVPAATPALTVAGRGIIYSQLNATNSFSFFANGAVIIPFVNGVAGSGFINVSGGNMTGALALSADPINPMQAATKQYVDTMLPLTGGTLTGPLVLAGDATAALNPVSLQQLDASIAAARYIPQLDPSNDVAVTAAGAAPILSGYENPVSAGDDWFMIRTMRDVDGTAIIMRGDTFPDPNAADGIEFWIGSGGNFLVHFQPDGQVILPIDPTDAMAAVTKQYADALGGGASVEVGDTAPASPASGDLWWDTVSVKLYMWDGGQWVVVSNVPGEPGPAGPAGPPGPQAPIMGVTDGSAAQPGEVGEVLNGTLSGFVNAGAGMTALAGSFIIPPGAWLLQGWINVTAAVPPNAPMTAALVGLTAPFPTTAFGFTLASTTDGYSMFEGRVRPSSGNISAPTTVTGSMSITATGATTANAIVQLLAIRIR